MRDLLALARKNKKTCSNWRAILQDLAPWHSAAPRSASLALHLAISKRGGPRGLVSAGVVSQPSLHPRDRGSLLISLPCQSFTRPVRSRLQSICTMRGPRDASAAVQRDLLPFGLELDRVQTASLSGSSSVLCRQHDYRQLTL